MQMRSDETRAGARIGWAVLALLLISAAGCDREAPSEGAGLDTEAFTTVVVELRRAERDLMASDSPVEAFARRKAEILSEHGVTEEDLREYLRARSDPGALGQVWDTVNERLRSVPPGRDSTPAWAGDPP